MKPIILTIAAHPDDEVLGCGATMARLAEEGHEVHVLILAEGLTSRDTIRDRDSKLGELSLLTTKAKEANQLLGVKSTETHDFPDNRMDSVDRLDVIKVIEKKMEEIQPYIIFTHFGNDLNIDHRIANDAVVTACRSYPGQMVKELYFFEVPSSTEWQISSGQFGFQPNVFFSLTNDQIDKKRKALEIYNSEMRDFPHSRSFPAVEALAKWRGASCGHAWAEAFVVGRILR
jgi:N-acetylglucosamine malate deacetylase 1